MRARARYADDLAEQQLLKRVKPRRERRQPRRVGRRAAARRHLHPRRRAGDRGERRRDREVGRNRTLGRHVVLEDVYGNRYSYARARKDERTRSKAGTRVRGGGCSVASAPRRTATAPHVSSRSGRPAAARRGSTRSRSSTAGSCSRPPSIYRANGKNVLRSGPTIGQILLLSKAQLQKRVLADERIEIYPCGRADISAGQIDRRVLGNARVPSESGLSPTVSSLRCGHSYHTKSGNVSEHASGTRSTSRGSTGSPCSDTRSPAASPNRPSGGCMQLQGAFAPHQVISLFAMGGPTIAMADHADHIHVGFGRRAAARAAERAGAEARPVATADDRLSELPNPMVGPGTRRPVGAR